MLDQPAGTIRALLDELSDEVRRCSGAAEDLGLTIFGPRPASEANSKDPRGDMRSMIERILSRTRELGSELTRINNAIGVPNNAGAQIGPKAAEGRY